MYNFELNLLLTKINKNIKWWCLISSRRRVVSMLKKDNNTSLTNEILKKMWIEYEPYIRKFCTFKLNSMSWLIDDCIQEVFLD